jgi:hypothetical protein
VVHRLRPFLISIPRAHLKTPAPREQHHKTAQYRYSVPQAEADRPCAEEWLAWKDRKKRIAREQVEEEEQEKAGILHRKALRKWASNRE